MREEIFDPSNRRFRYAFTNCTIAAPASQLSRIFLTTAEHDDAGLYNVSRCQQEYDDPLNRRFHAQPNACPDCGLNWNWSMQTAKK